MDNLRRLSAEHADLRRDAAALEALIGPQSGVGWDDESKCDLPAFRAACERLSRELRAHETREEALMARGLRGPGSDEIEAEIERAHKTLNELTALLHSAATVCSTGRVYQLRTITDRVRQELEAHLVYEEKVLFPLLRDCVP